MKFLLIQFSLILIFINSKSFASGSDIPTWISDDSDSDAPASRVPEVTNSRKRTANDSNEDMREYHENSDILESPELLIEQVKSMQDQEGKVHYKRMNYFDLDLPVIEDDEGRVYDFQVTPTARQKIIEWEFQLIDHFDMDRKTVALSLKLLDRYLAYCKSSNELEKLDAYLSYTKRGFQLAAMATLYLAIKIGEPKKLKASDFIELSRGFFKVEHLFNAEQSIMGKLNYRISFPLEADYLYRFSVLLSSGDFLSTSLNDNTLLKGIYHNAQFLTELAQADSFFVPFSSAQIAFAAIINAMEHTNYNNGKRRMVFLNDETKLEFYNKAAAEFGLVYDSHEINNLKDRLMLLYNSVRQ